MSILVLLATVVYVKSPSRVEGTKGDEKKEQDIVRESVRSNCLGPIRIFLGTRTFGYSAGGGLGRQALVSSGRIPWSRTSVKAAFNDSRLVLRLYSQTMFDFHSYF